MTITATRKPAVRSIVRWAEDKGMPRVDHILVTSKGVRIGGSYYGVTVQRSQEGPWISWGIAGFSFGHKTRAAAEAVQIEKWNSGPDNYSVVINMQGKALRVLESLRSNSDRTWWTEEEQQAAIARQEAWVNELECRASMLCAEKVTRR